MSTLKLSGLTSGSSIIKAPDSGSTGVTFTLPASAGTLAKTSDITGGANGVDFNDNVKARFGTGNDLEIYHDGSNSVIHDVGTGNLLLKGDNLSLRNASNESYLTGVSNGEVSVYHDNSVKLQTTATGVTVTGATNSTVMPTFGGVAIVAKGTNSNGSYTKWADGSMICEATKSTSQQNNGATAGAFYYSNSNTWTYPVAFNATPRIVTNTRGGHWNAIASKTHAEGSTSCSFNTLSINSTGNAQEVSLLAYGTWS